MTNSTAATPHRRAATAGDNSRPGVTWISTPRAVVRGAATGSASPLDGSIVILTMPLSRPRASSRDTFDTEKWVSVAISGWLRPRT